MPALPELLTAHPRLRIDVLVRDRIDNLLAEGVDVAIRFGDPDARGLDKQAILQSRVVTCATPAYLAAHGTPEAPEDIADRSGVRLIDDVTGKPHSWDFLNHAGETRSIAPDCSLVVNDAPLLVAAALNHVGIVRLLDFIAEEHLRAGRLVEVLPTWNRRMWPAYLYTPETSHPSPAIQAFKRFVFERDFLRRALMDR